MTLVVDASVAIKWFVREAGHEAARLLLDEPESLAAPDLLIPELTNVAWKKATRGEIGQAQAAAIASAVRGGVPLIYPSALFHEQALALAFALGHSVHDCLYLACAQALDGTLVTADAAFADAAGKAGLAKRLQLLASVS